MSRTQSSAIYVGEVRHRRLEPKRNDFRYRVFMLWLDLDELPTLCERSGFWSDSGRALAEYRRSDYFGDPDKPLKQAVLDWVEHQCGDRPQGAVRMLTNLRYYGFLINPITCYYCYGPDDQLQKIVLEVTNTPWGRKQCYLLSCDSGPSRGGSDSPQDDSDLSVLGSEEKGADDLSVKPLKGSQVKPLTGAFKKEMHVSPFHPMNMEYRWRLNLPGPRLHLHFDNCLEGRKVFDATLTLQKEALTPASQRSILWRYPFMTLRVWGAIHWQALKLLIKRVPLYPNPHKNPTVLHNQN